MKLIDILARDLPQWSEGVTLIGQDKNGHLSYLMLEQRDGYWSDRIEVFSDDRVELASDQSEALVRRGEWADRIAINELLNGARRTNRGQVNINGDDLYGATGDLQAQHDYLLGHLSNVNINGRHNSGNDILGVAITKVKDDDD